MRVVNNIGVGDSARTLLVNRVHVLLWTSAWMLGIGFVMLLRTGRIVATRCTKHSNKTDNVLNLMKF